MAVSLITGKIVYISDQAASILNCKREIFTNAKFVEFLTPQDVSVFYSFTTPYRLPSWSMCTGAGTCRLASSSLPVGWGSALARDGKHTAGHLRIRPSHVRPRKHMSIHTQHIFSLARHAIWFARRPPAKVHARTRLSHLSGLQPLNPQFKPLPLLFNFIFLYVWLIVGGHSSNTCIWASHNHQVVVLFS